MEMDINNLNIISKYEVKLLLRSWLFRIFAILSILGLTGFIIIQFTGILNSWRSSWSSVSVFSFMALNVTYYYVLVQSIIVVLLAGNFLKRDKKLDTAEVIYVKAMSNTDYVLGKTLGILKVFIGLNIIMLIIGAFINTTVNQIPLNIYPYIIYILIISIPSIIFVLGLSFTIMNLVNNQAITFIIMLGITVLSLIYGPLYFNGLFDLFGINIPNAISGITGFAHPKILFLQRFSYLLCGIGFITLTCGIINRLANKPWKSKALIISGLIITLVACIVGYNHYSQNNKILSQRQVYREIFKEYAEKPNVSMTQSDINIKTSKNYLEAENKITVANNNKFDLNKIILYLNPALKIESLSSESQKLSFTRNHQVIIVDKKLLSGGKKELDIKYRGQIDENICYTDISDEDFFKIFNLENKIRGSKIRPGYKFAYLDKNYTLLTPECMWYPTTTSISNPNSKYYLKKDFTLYKLKVYTPLNKIAISQGKMIRKNDSTMFSNGKALLGLSLSIADYEKKSIVVDSIEYGLYYYKGHDFFSRYFSHMQDTIIPTIREFKEDIERNNNETYKFNKLLFVEAPVHFANYQRAWKGHMENEQAEIIYIGEKGSNISSDFSFYKKQISRRSGRDLQGESTPEEEEVRIFKRFFRDLLSGERSWFINSKNQISISPLLFSHTRYILSNKYPIFGVIANYLQNSSSTETRRRMTSIINNTQRANYYLGSNSFKDALKDSLLKEDILIEIIKLKANELRNYIESFISAEELETFFKNFYKLKLCKEILYEDFTNEFYKKFNINLDEYISLWYSIKSSPSFFLRQFEVKITEINETTKYQINFKVYNQSDVDGILSTNYRIFSQSGSRGRNRQRNDNSNNKNNYYIIKAHKAYNIKIITDDIPSLFKINTNISNNLPSEYSYSFNDVSIHTKDTLAGLFEINPTIFDNNSSDIIIDDTDPGFKIIESNTKHKLKDLFIKKDDDKYHNFSTWRIPSKWTRIAAEYCYGDIIHSAYYKKAGTGLNYAEWTTSIIKEGTYEIFIWNGNFESNLNYLNVGMRIGGNRFMSRMMSNSKEQTYNVKYNIQKKETITLDLKKETVGWISLGTFYLNKGKVTITLTDRVKSSYVIADAVKFTLIK